MATEELLFHERAHRTSTLLECAASSYSVLSRVYFDAAESARQTSDPALLAELEEMADKFAESIA